MEERLKALRGYLPDEVIDSAKVWGILSAGIHELSEEECRKMFPVLEAVTLMILQIKDKADKDKADKDRLAKKLITELEGFQQAIVGEVATLRAAHADLGRIEPKRELTARALGVKPRLRVIEGGQRDVRQPLDSASTETKKAG
jgi:hypothetical protein